MAAELKLIAGGGLRAPLDPAKDCAPAKAGAQTREAQLLALPARTRLLPSQEHWEVPGAGAATLAELFAAGVRDGGWTGFLLPQLPADRPWLWVQERMAWLEAGRLYPPGLGDGAGGLIHVAARNAREALWAMEEGLRCAAIGAVIGELYGDPQALDFTATRRLAVAAERHGVAAYLIRLGGHANLSGARLRWRVASSPSLLNPLNPKAPGAAAWRAELFRVRGGRPGDWTVAHEGGGKEGGFRLVAGAGDRALDEDRRAAS